MTKNWVTPNKIREYDPRLRTTVMAKTPNPQQIIWYGMRQCCYYQPVDQIESPPEESRAGELVVEKLLEGERGHWSPFEHNSITFNVAGFAHNAMVQIRTHRTGVGFSVQSGRYCGDQFIKVAKGEWNPEEAFFIPPPGLYLDREGNRVEFTEEKREYLVQNTQSASEEYRKLIEEGFPPERARSVLPWDIVRQHFIFTANARSLMHIMDLRTKKDAQLEIRTMAHMFFEKFKEWMPEVAEFYESERLEKAKLSP